MVLMDIGVNEHFVVDYSGATTKQIIERQLTENPSPGFSQDRSGGKAQIYLIADSSGNSVYSINKLKSTEEVVLDSQVNIGAVIEFISSTFCLTRNDFIRICHVESRKTINNWIKGSSIPREYSINRIFELERVAKDWNALGYPSSKILLKKSVMDGRSLIQYLEENVLDKEAILFLGSRLLLDTVDDAVLVDPFA